MLRTFNRYIPHVSWAVAFIGLCTSLFFSEILKFPPCVLCWYQRILMYPLVLIIAVGILRKDEKIYQYVLPLSVIGLFISLYHNLLYYKIIPDLLAPCELGVSCTTKFIEWFGFITIPFLAFCGFLLITILMLAYRRGVLKDN